MDHAFGNTSAFTVGVEEELLLVAEDGARLVHDAERLLAAIDLPESAAGHEAFASEIELRSAPSATGAEAAEQLRQGRRAAERAGATLMGAGLHPTAELGDAELVDLPRYATVDETMRGLIRRTPECALHVHVGMPGPEEAIRACNGLRRHLPLLIGLAANSPWWFGRDSALASARWAIVRSYPTRGVPRAFRDFADYAETVDAYLAASGHDDPTFAWWDVRPHPRLGTVEVREMDVQSRLGDAAGLAALVRGLAIAAVEDPVADELPTEAISESCFRAARDGLDATLWHDGALRPLAEVARAAIELAAPQTPGGELEAIERIVREGNGAHRRRAAHLRGGVEAMLAEVVSETRCA
jgi:carboxylate-amine ligase